MAQAGLILINLENQGAFVFEFSPASLRTSDRANWQPQETTVGVKPLFYMNREPRQIEFPEVYLDNTMTGESLTGKIEELRMLLEETEKGTPPVLLVGWGDRNERCVLEELSIEECFFNSANEPTRARVSLSFLQIQPDGGETTGVRVGE